MSVLPVSNLAMVEEHEATEEVARIYDDVKQVMQIPAVPNMMKAVAISPGSLAAYWAFTKTLIANITLPQSLVSMILYTIAEKNNCEYCSASHELTCRTLGIDEETLAKLVQDLGNVNPQRVKTIIEFALKAAKYPQSLVEDDYEEVRWQGVSDEEIVEIILIAGAGVYGDILADALKIEVDTTVREALSQL